MPLNETFTEIIAKLTQRIDELKTQISELKTQTSELDTKYTTTYNTSIGLADAIKAQQEEIKKLKEKVNNIDNTRSETFTTPPTADGTGLPGFVVLNTKPETEYKNYVYIYPRD